MRSDEEMAAMFQAVSVRLFLHYQLHNDIFHLFIQMSANFYLIQVHIPGIYLPECIKILQCNVLVFLVTHLMHRCCVFISVL